MNSTLNSIPMDKIWLKQREQEWKIYEDRTFFSGSTPKKEMTAYREYFVGGDIDEFTKKYTPAFASLVFLSPVQSLADLQLVIEESFYWCLKNQENPDWLRRNHKYKGDWGEFLMGTFEYCWSSNELYSSEYKLCIELFNWIFGERYDPDRIIELVPGETLSRVHVKFNVSFMCMRMLSGLSRYLWYPHERERYKRYKYIADYFLSLYPNNDKVCFSKQSPQRRDTIIDGKNYIRGEFLSNRAFIASMNNILTPYDEEEDVTELVPSDAELLEKLREGLRMPAMPPEYYELEKFVIKHGYDCLYASE